MQITLDETEIQEEITYSETQEKPASPVGRIVAISISKKRGIPKSNVPFAKLIEDYGIEGDAHAGKWHRQISFLAMESVEKMRRAGLPKLRPGAFAENITTEFIDIPHIEIGTKVKIGKDTILEITQIGKECHTKCAIYARIGDCVMPKEGIFAKVLKSGEIYVGDKVIIER
jgi:MOSC domain-containing protein YiiM